jgi:hypothetical protein
LFVKVYEKVVKILEVYFAASEEEAIEGIAPAQQGNAFQFGGGNGNGNGGEGTGQGGQFTF